MDFLIKSGICGIAIIFLTCFLALFSVLFIAATRSRRVAILFAVASFLPLLIGVSCTFFSERMIEEQIRIEEAVSKPKPHPHPDDAEAVGRQEAKIPTYMGLGGTALLLAISGCGMVLGRKPAIRKD